MLSSIVLETMENTLVVWLLENSFNQYPNQSRQLTHSGAISIHLSKSLQFVFIIYVVIEKLTAQNASIQSNFQ